MRCDSCGEELQVGDWPYCPHGSALPHRPFRGYTITHEGKTYTIDSIQAAARVERETMQNYKEGKGAPIVLRAFHQDHSNRDKNTLEGFGESNPPIQRRTQRGTPIGTGRGRLPHGE